MSKILHKNHPCLLVRSQMVPRLYTMYQLPQISSTALGEPESSSAFSQKECGDWFPAPAVGWGQGGGTMPFLSGQAFRPLRLALRRHLPAPST